MIIMEILNQVIAEQNNGPFFKVTKIDKKVDKDGAYTYYRL